MVLLGELSSPFGGAAMFYVAGGFTGLSSLLFLILPPATAATDKENSNSKEMSKEDTNAEKSLLPQSGPRVPSPFTISCTCLGVLAVGLEVGAVVVSHCHSLLC